MNANYVKNVFKAYDEDKDGFLTKSEAIYAAQEFGIDKRDLRIIKSLKLDDEALIPVTILTEEIKCFCMMKFRKDPLLEMFKRVDLDGSGQLSFAEVKLVMDAFGVGNMTAENVVQELFFKADKNHDGLINQSEYLTFMQEMRATTTVTSYT